MKQDVFTKIPVPHGSFIEGVDWEWKKRWCFFWWRRKAVLLRNVILEVNGRFVMIPKGFTWNGPTFFLATPARMFASLVHDYLYRMRPHGVTQEQADDIFKRMMQRNDSDDWFCDIMEPPFSMKGPLFGFFHLPGRLIRVALFRIGWRFRIG